MSAGLVLYRWRADQLEFLLVHPGGPFWKSKDAAAWSIPKGELLEAEEPLAAAQREFAEELGFAPAPPFLELTPVRQKSGKVVCAWAVEGDCDPQRIRSNHFALEWPPGSGKLQEFPEIDRAAFTRGNGAIGSIHMSDEILDEHRFHRVLTVLRIDIPSGI